MIEVMEGLPDKVVGAHFSGVVKEEEYNKVLVPAIVDEVKKYGKVRLLYDVGPDFEKITRGAVLEDMKLAVDNFNSVEKIAVVSDVDWMVDAVEMFKHIMPGKVKAYGNEELSEAETWISE
ncbi:STAS/SEC14 domain-containing protein [Methanolobus sp. ZRKC2]|uniref:STAS/SEC14 domain-containing protein n=1 Tax=Methanolobus sp. ZRKC2 TaxID=3125783 RepID=UPI003245A3E4